MLREKQWTIKKNTTTVLNKKNTYKKYIQNT